METANILKYKGSSVEDVLLNDSTLSSIIWNDVQWSGEGSGPEPPVVEFTLAPYMIDTKSSRVNLDMANTMYVTGNSVFLAKVNQGTDLSQLSIDSYDSAVKPMIIDNWGILFSRLYSYGDWEGGKTNMTFNVTETLSLGSNTISFNFRNEVDEDDTVMLEGFYLNKVIKIPSTGVQNKTIRIHKFFMRFNSYGCPNPHLFALDYQRVYGGDEDDLPVFYNNGFYSTDNGTRYRDTDNVDPEHEDLLYPLSSTALSSLSIAKDGMDYILSYSASVNSTQDFKHLAIIVQGPVLISFLQEPASDNRIYFGVPQDECYTHATNGSSYYDEGTSDYVYPYNYEFYFHSLGSYDLTGLETFEVSYPDKYSLVYPSDIEERFTITTSGTGTNPIAYSPNGLSWGGKNYSKRDNIPSTRTYIFTKKV